MKTRMLYIPVKLYIHFFVEFFVHLAADAFFFCSCLLNFISIAIPRFWFIFFLHLLLLPPESLLLFASTYISIHYKCDYELIFGCWTKTAKRRSLVHTFCRVHWTRGSSFAFVKKGKFCMYFLCQVSSILLFILHFAHFTTLVRLCFVCICLIFCVFSSWLFYGSCIFRLQPVFPLL